jgi:DNA processing protein
MPKDYKILLKSDREYPANLRDIDDAPEKIYVKGEILPSDKKAVAIIGSRHMTDYGKKVAWDFSLELAKRGVTIVSGMARGIDSIAHKAALYAGGRTIAVLGSGIDVIYPPENRTLVQSISKSGVVITEFPPGMKPFAKNFLQRNRIISGLSLGILVVEGAKRSGTLSTTGWAANQGREVFAIPGRIDSEMSYLPNYLIDNGATIAKDPSDIVEYIDSLNI